MLRKSLWQHVRSAGGRLLRKLHVRESTIQTIKAAVTAPPPPLYPLDIPAIAIQPGLDFLLLELPPRYQPMMPNGIGYVHNVLLKTGVRFQTVDANVLMYHRYHQSRILGGVPLVTPGGYAMKDDPWDNTNTAEWEREDILDFFWPEIADLLRQIVRNGVKAVGISVHASNRVLAKRFVRELRALAPEVAVVVGGYDCVYASVGPSLFPDFDYMVIFEGELTVGPLVSALARGQRPKDLPGIISRFDTPGRVWEPAPLLADLDSVDYPRYPWAEHGFVPDLRPQAPGADHGQPGVQVGALPLLRGAIPLPQSRAGEGGRRDRRTWSAAACTAFTSTRATSTAIPGCCTTFARRSSVAG